MQTPLCADRVSAMGRRILARGGSSQQAYRLRLAQSQDDIGAAQTLRFIVFNVEMGEGLEDSYLTCRDADRFDAACDHLLVESGESREIVGTYRLQTGATAGARHGYYSETEFDFSPFEPMRGEMIELGRACVHSAHRNLAVLGLLWRGIAAYARERSCRYLIGCSSLTSQDPREGAAVYSRLLRRHAAPANFQTRPQPGYVCPMDETADQNVDIPKLLSAYLSIGAKICAPPALDQEFKTIDFLTLLDLESLAPSAAKLLA